MSTPSNLVISTAVLSWLHRAWLGLAILVAVMALFAWLHVHVERPKLVIEQLCGYQKAIEAARFREGRKPTEVDEMLVRMRGVCRAEVADY